jgi:hypothetical protein
MTRVEDNDLATPARAALTADSAVAANKDHKMLIHLGVAPTVNVPPTFTDRTGQPDERVVVEVHGRLEVHRGERAKSGWCRGQECSMRIS